MSGQTVSVSRQPANVRAPENINASAGVNAPKNENDSLSFQQVQQEELAALGGKDRQRSALCISGGGIRSATFALGALQGLADLGILENFDYLSTVSGGGYIGSWLTAWKHRWNGLTTPNGPDKATVVSRLRPFAPPPVHPPDPIQSFRESSEDLFPRLDFSSLDTWTFAGTVIRNAILNWLVVVPLLMGALAFPRIVLSVARLGDTVDKWYVPSVGRWFDYLHVIVPLLGALCFAIGVLNVLRYLPSVGRRNHTQGQFLKYCFAPIFLAALALVTTDAWFTGGGKDYATTLGFWELFFWIGISGAAGYVTYAVFCWRDVASKFRELDEKKKTRKWPKVKWVIVPFLAGVLTNFGTAGSAWLLVSRLLRHLNWPVYVTLAMPLLVISFTLAITVFVGFTSLVLGDDDREWLARAGAWGLLCIVLWAGLCALTLLAPQILNRPLATFAKLDSVFAALGGISGLVAILGGRRSKTTAKAKTRKAKRDSKRKELLGISGKIAAPVFIFVSLAYLTILTNWILSSLGMVEGDWRNHWAFLENTRAEDAVLLAVVCIAFSWYMSKFIDINKFSLLAIHRSRLIRACLGASNDVWYADNFTGFHQTDNLPMGSLDPSKKPFHVVNIALNLDVREKLERWRRKVASFTVSPLHCGSDDLCYRRTIRYGGEGGISLGTAVAISGAAGGSNMVYHSSPAMTFIMTLFKARQGFWLGNPVQFRWRDGGPRSAFDSTIREVLGLTNDTSPYVYLTDGGHFDNLALYEMVRRRCRYIIVLDCGFDPAYSYEDLGNVIRKIRIDMKIDIHFDSELAPPLPGSKPAKRCALAQINYKDVDPSLENGYLIYIKLVVLETDPPDVTAYKAANDAFPHESTGYQWFNESQTESYRMLGLCSVLDVFTRWGNKQQFEGVMQSAMNHLMRPAAKGAAGGQQ